MRVWFLSDGFFNGSGLPDIFQVDFFPPTAFDFPDLVDCLVPFTTSSLAGIFDIFLGASLTCSGILLSEIS